MTEAPFLPPQEHIGFARVDVLGGLELVHIQTLHHQFERHTHDHHVVGLVEQGTERFWHRGQQLMAATGDLSLVNPEAVHTGAPATPEGYSYRAFYPDEAFLQQVANTAHPLHFQQAVAEDRQLGALLLQVHRTVFQRQEAGQPIPDLALETGLMLAFRVLLQRHAGARTEPEPAKDPGRARLVRDMLETQLR